MPLRYRRVILALRYVQYTLNLEERVFAASGVKDSLDLHQHRLRGWVMDLEYVLYRLPVWVVAPDWDGHKMKTNDWFRAVEDRIYRSCDAWIEGTVLSSTRLWMVHQSFREIRAKVDRKREPRRLYFARRQVWTAVQNPDHRRALARLVASNHRLAVEMLLRGDGQRRKPVPREWRLCRFCRASVEDKVHALLFCNGSCSLVALRNVFWNELDLADHSWKALRERSQGFFVLHTLLSSERSCPRFARYVSDVFTLFDESPLFIPAAALYEHEGGPVEDAIQDDDGDDPIADEDAVEALDCDDYIALSLRGFG